MGEEPAVRILFVCSGNICRSAMAAEYARHRVAASGLRHAVVDSAGTLGIEGERAFPEAIEVLREHGLHLGNHRSRGLREQDFKTADLVIVMTLAHLDEIDNRFPLGAAPRRLLRAFEKGVEPRDGAEDLEDPIGKPLEAYRECFEIIKTCVDHLVLHLKHEP